MEKEEDRIFYSLNVIDIQEVAQDILGHRLNKKEVDLVEQTVGDYIDWYQAIEHSIIEKIIIPKKTKLKK